MTPASSVRLIAPWLTIVLAGLLAAALRYRLVEPAILVQWCSRDTAPTWCAWRQLVVQGFLSYAYGYAALAATVWALLGRRVALACLAAALGAFALQLYCVDAGAFALLAGSLRLLRLQASAQPPRIEYRQREHQVERQP